MGNILDYLENRTSLELSDTQLEKCDTNIFLSKGISVINVDGALTHKPVKGVCGEVAGCSYTGLLKEVEYSIESGASTIVLDISSPGGQASHIGEYAQEIRNICDTTGTSLTAYVDEMACSAAYWLACICDEVIANPDAITGSIGAVVALTDVSKAMDNAGVKRVFITSGSSKVPFAEDGSFKQEFLTKIQKDVDMLNDKFAEHVSKYTGLAVEDIKALNAETFNADEALEIGLINSIMTNSEFAAYISAKHKAKTKGAINA